MVLCMTEICAAVKLIGSMRLLRSLVSVILARDETVVIPIVANVVNCKGRGIVTPRLLTRAQAAAYCGVCVATFSTLCPVQPVTLGQGKRLHRFDIVALDKWIDQLDSNGATSGRDWLATWEASNDPRSR
jgi:hypothetical protein